MADCGNHCIQVFTAEGKFLRMFGRRGEGRGMPFGVAIDSSDRVYVSDYLDDLVSVFTLEGQLWGGTRTVQRSYWTYSG